MSVHTSSDSTSEALQVIAESLETALQGDCSVDDSIVECSIGESDSLELSVMECNVPPSVQIIYNTGDVVTYNHIFNESEQIGDPTGLTADTWNVTVHCISEMAIGLKVGNGAPTCMACMTVTYLMHPHAWPV